MNRAIFLIMIPAVLVMAGYIIVLRAMGIAPGYSRLIIAVVVFLGAIFWFSRRAVRKVNSDRT